MDINQYIKYLTQEAEHAMIAEVEAGPKPGLVDRYNNGSHQDMDINTFRISAQTLAPEFEHFMELSNSYGSDMVLPILRAPGMEAEAKMYQVTHGFNTHKGLIFSLGLIVACLVRLAKKLDRKPSWGDRKALVDLIRLNTKRLTEELETSTEQTNGLLVFQTYGLKGIRQEAEEGFPAIFNYGLPKLKEYKTVYKDDDLPLLMTLLELILVTGDTNLVKRGGLDGLNFMQARSLSILIAAPKLTEPELLERFKTFDEVAISKNLSPGGAADNLAICIFLDQVLT